ncbi:hypothetical protein MHTCC0001_14460 [Flavobacteriaceae bacterium MHTCC 0001]
MRTYLFCAFSTWLLCIGISKAQQISVQNNLSAAELVESNFIEGCVAISNIQSNVNGAVNGISSFGAFQKSDSNFPFEKGIVLTTGNVLASGNQLDEETLNNGFPSWGTDSDLEQALGISGTLNATAIEFDFISAANQIQFNYILASEEYYSSFACEYSDGFAFLIKEAGTANAYENIALIPGTSIAVNTNTIHNEIVGFCDAQHPEYFEGYDIGDTNYNGRTTVLTATASIKPNTTYHIKLVIADQNDKNYDSAVFIEGNSFNASVDLGEDIQTCAGSVNLDANIDNPVAMYTWYFNDEVIDGQTSSNLNVNISGDYKVTIEIPVSNFTCMIEDTISISISNVQPADTISDYAICDDISNDGIETFDLNTKLPDILAAVPEGNYNVSFHSSLSDAENNTNPLQPVRQNTTSTEQIYVRIIDTDSGCLAYGNFNIVVHRFPNIVTPQPLYVCDDEIGDGITQIDLNSKNEEIIGQQTDLNISYHLTATDAENNTNALTIPYTNNTRSETLYLRVENDNSGCYTTTSLDVHVVRTPFLNRSQIHYIDACDKDYDGFASFDLTASIPDVLNGLTNVSTSFYMDKPNAVAGTNPITNPTNFNNTVANRQVVYLRVEHNNTGCASTIPIELHTNLLLTATNLNSVSICDFENDNSEGYNLNNLVTHVSNRISYIDVEVYETESERDSQTSPLDTNVPYPINASSKTFYLVLNTPTCTEFESINISLTPITYFDSIGTVDYCDTDQDGFTNINLQLFNADVVNNQLNFSVSYFLDETDAYRNSNAVGYTHTNTSNPQTYYARIRSNITGCFSVSTFQVNVIEAPMTSPTTPILFCDEDGDGIATIDLTSKIDEIRANKTNMKFTFHTTAEDAEHSVAPIPNTSAHVTASNTFYLRVENTLTGCHTVEPVEVIVNTLPVINDISSYQFCKESNQPNNGVGSFILNTKDDEILNGQPNKTIFYYRTENDALNHTNVIDKDTPFTNSSNPQTIYTRVENLNDSDCFAVAPFVIEVGVYPPFNTPEDWFVCDGIYNDGTELFDLNVVAEDIQEGINDNLSITFHASLVDAENFLDPVPRAFNNTENPQRIYARIDNGNICKSITSFELNVIQVPEPNIPEPLEVCDTDFDESTNFNITLANSDILDVRQDNLEIGYFETIIDLENNSNRIPNPEHYTNTSNPQTVYVKLTNTISNCYSYVALDLIVIPPPLVNDFKVYEACDVGSVDLNAINTVAINDTMNVLISYHNTYDDAFNDTNSLNYNYTYTSNTTNLFIRVEDINAPCFAIYPFTLQILELPMANKPQNMEQCNDDFDDSTIFNLSNQDTTILGNQDPNNFKVVYFNDETSAHNNTNALNLKYNATNNETIYARVENVNTGCYSITNFKTIVHPLPKLDVGDQTICLEKFPLRVDAYTGNNLDTYLWSTNETTSEIIIETIGTYSVTATSPKGCTITSVFNVILSEQATIETTETVDFSDPNNITLTVSGIGNYMFILDDNAPQDHGHFTNVGIGHHEITIIDLNGCTEVTKEVMIVDVPKFVTPNNDGHFDTWHFSGIETIPGTKIDIFDRYGKLLAHITSNTPGWDGTLNGANLPQDDYWYKADVHYKNSRFELKGHFTLKR